MLKKAAYWFSVVAIGVTVGLSLQFVKAWAEPTVAPPNVNVDAPINTGAASQYKSGALGIGGVLSAYGSLRVSDIFAPGGKNILVGDESYLSDVDIANTLGIYGNQDTTQGHIKLGSGGPTISGVSGNVGIGKTTPETSSPNGIAGNLDINDAYIRAVGKWASQLGGGSTIVPLNNLYTKYHKNYLHGDDPVYFDGADPVFCESGDKMVSGDCWLVGYGNATDSAYGGKPVGENGWQCMLIGGTASLTTYVRCSSAVERHFCFKDDIQYSPGQKIIATTPGYCDVGAQCPCPGVQCMTSYPCGASGTQTDTLDTITCQSDGTWSSHVITQSAHACTLENIFCGWDLCMFP